MRVFRSERVPGLVTTRRKDSCLARSEDCLIGGRRHSAGRKGQRESMNDVKYGSKYIVQRQLLPKRIQELRIYDAGDSAPASQLVPRLLFQLLSWLWRRGCFFDCWRLSDQ